MKAITSIVAPASVGTPKAGATLAEFDNRGPPDDYSRLSTSYSAHALLKAYGPDE